MIAVSSILSFDLYKTYINPKASDKRLVRVSHISVVIHAIFITVFSIALNYGGADMTWIGYFRPVLTCPGIIPLIFTLCWKGQTRLALIVSPILGFVTGLAIWLGTAYHLYGEINLTTTEAGLPALYGAMGSFFSPAIYSVLISQYKPYYFDWREFLRIEIADMETIESSSSSTNATLTEEIKDKSQTTNTIEPISATPSSDKIVPTVVRSGEKSSKTPSAISLDDIQHPFSKETLAELHRWYRIAWIAWVFIVLITFVAWPMPLYRDYIFTKAFFKSWTSVAILWQFMAFFAVVVFPLYDGRKQIVKGARGVWNSSRTYLRKK
jgi:hypothetical protein